MIMMTYASILLLQTLAFTLIHNIIIAQGLDDSTGGCSQGNCSRSLKLDRVLVNLSNNAMINVTTDTILSSNVLLVDLKGILIVGYNNPTVTCINGGKIYILSCHNFTIEGIIWNGCGDQSLNKNISPVIQFHNSSNITIRNCSFQHSVGQAVVLSDISGAVYIDNCKFLNNSQYQGNGTAIYHSSSKVEHSKHVFTINNCIFSYNGGKATVYVDQSAEVLLLENSVFHKNQGIPIYISNKGLIINGFTLFEGNIARNGPGGIYVDHYSSIHFSKTSTVVFNNNIAGDFGGAVFIQTYASALFHENCQVTFSNNRANFGGAVCSERNSIILFKRNSTVNFTGNSVATHGGAVYLNTNVNVTFDSCNVILSNNNATLNGGGLYANINCNITSKGNSTAKFINNRAKNGGASFCRHNSNIIILDNSKVTFSFNNAGIGGASYYRNNSKFISDYNARVMFGYNTAMDYGGAVYLRDNSKALFAKKSAVTFNDNRASELGGALYFYSGCCVTITGDSTANFTNNNAENLTGSSVYNLKLYNGGSIYYERNSNFTLRGNSRVTFGFNSAVHFGGAVYLLGNSNALFMENASVTFNDNTAGAGGALYFNGNCHVAVGGNSTVNFISNKAERGDGGALLKYCNAIWWSNIFI